MPPPLQLHVVRDYLAEGWPSMDLCADQLIAHWNGADSKLRCTEIAPDFRRIVSRAFPATRFGFNADRLLNRHVWLPSVVERQSATADFVHIVDHSYAHLVHSVQPGKAGVYCHDLDAFDSLLEPEKQRRPWWFRILAKRTLSGLQSAALVFHNSAEVGKQLLEFRLVESERLVHARLGVAVEFTAEPNDVTEPAVESGAPFLLHVGTNTPRKRLDILLEVFANVRRQVPDLRLVQVGGPWPSNLEQQLDRLQIRTATTQVRDLSRHQLADLYRRCALTLVTSEAEGFGLPVIEALACGAVVVASDLPSLREAGGGGAVYCPVADLTRWTETVVNFVQNPEAAPDRASRLAHAASFSWKEHSRIIGEAYLSLGARRQESGAA